VAQVASPYIAPQRPTTGAPVIGVTDDKTSPVVGQQNGEIRSCVAGDQSPNGAVKDGYRKVVVPGPFGPSCHWEPAK